MANISFNQQYRYQNGINHPNVFVTPTELSMRNNGFMGANIDQIIQNPIDTNQLIASGIGGNYLTKNYGETWKLIKINNYKYRGSNNADAPRIFWDKDGKMITAINKNIYCSSNGKDWRVKTLENDILNIGYALGGIWVETIDYQNNSSFGWVFSNGEDCLVKEVLINEEIKEIEAIKKENQRPPCWNIINHKVVKRDTTTLKWEVKCNGIERPQLTELMQHAKNQNVVLAREDYSIHEKNPQGIHKYWITDDFGENWRQVNNPEEVLDTFQIANYTSKHDLRKTHKKQMLLNNQIVYQNTAFAHEFFHYGFINNNAAYFLADNGIQISKINNNGTQGDAFFWYWGAQNPKNNEDYNQYFGLDKNETRKMVYRKNKGIIEIMMPSSYGGIWYTTIDANTEPSFMHQFANSGIFFYYLITVIFLYIVFRNKKIKEAEIKESILMAKREAEKLQEELLHQEKIEITENEILDKDIDTPEKEENSHQTDFPTQHEPTPKGSTPKPYKPIESKNIELSQQIKKNSFLDKVALW